ncbi:hypothetical protein GEMRC1_000429 [Eukaryota sp. GEM-RC1]
MTPLPSLDELNVDMSKVSRSVTSKLDQIERGSTQFLRISNVDDNGAIAIAKAFQNSPGIARLHLNDNKIGNEGAVGLAAALKHGAHIKHLELSGNKIGCEGAVALAEGLKNHSGITEVDLSFNQIKDEGILALGDALKEHSSVTRLALGQNFFGQSSKAEVSRMLGSKVDFF